MLEKLNELYSLFKTLSQNNPIVAGAISLWGLGVITYICKDIPNRIWGFIKYQVTTVVTINNSDAIYYDLLKWTSKKKMHSFVRSLNFGKSDKFDSGQDQIMMGYGRQWFFFNNWLMFLNRVKEEANNTIEQKEQIYLTVLGRSHKIFEQLFEHIAKPDKDDDLYLKIYKYNFN